MVVVPHRVISSPDWKALYPLCRHCHLPLATDPGALISTGWPTSWSA